MADIEKLIAMLGSPKAAVRYEACELLRVAPELPREAVVALENAAQDPHRDVAESASSALRAHEAVDRPSQLPPEEEETRHREDATDHMGCSELFVGGCGLAFMILGFGVVFLAFGLRYSRDEWFTPTVQWAALAPFAIGVLLILSAGYLVLSSKHR